LLHAAIVAAADDLAVDDQCGTDGNAAFGESLTGLFDGYF